MFHDFLESVRKLEGMGGIFGISTLEKTQKHILHAQGVGRSGAWGAGGLNHHVDPAGSPPYLQQKRAREGLRREGRGMKEGRRGTRVGVG